MLSRSVKPGFTIVELLIVVIVIAVLATIGIISFNGIQNRSHDTAVQSDLRQLSKLIQQHLIEYNTLPVASVSSFPRLDTYQYSKASYGTHFVSNGNNYNMLYCRVGTTGPFALIAGSRSGKTYQMAEGSLTEIPRMQNGSATLCTNAGLTGSAVLWFYGQDGSNAWTSWSKG